jgi:hypothetical protein
MCCCINHQTMTRYTTQSSLHLYQMWIQFLTFFKFLWTLCSNVVYTKIVYDILILNERVLALARLLQERYPCVRGWCRHPKSQQTPGLQAIHSMDPWPTRSWRQEGYSILLCMEDTGQVSWPFRPIHWICIL